MVVVRDAHLLRTEALQYVYALCSLFQEHERRMPVVLVGRADPVRAAPAVTRQPGELRLHLAPPHPVNARDLGPRQARGPVGSGHRSSQ